MKAESVVCLSLWISSRNHSPHGSGHAQSLEYEHTRSANVCVFVILVRMLERVRIRALACGAICDVCERTRLPVCVRACS